MTEYKLTQFSHGAGCGCKISPQVLTEILGTSPRLNQKFTRLIVGNDHRDDAAVYDLGDGTAIISTTDFFMPIVDDPETFGRIASVNAISDVYAMGGTPMMAIAILGWPVDKLPSSVANAVMEGGRKACEDAGIPLAGGHSIDSPEPIFGLAVSGRVRLNQLKQNSGARAGDILFLTKPLGVGMFATAQKRGLLRDTDYALMCSSMTKLNDIGVHLAALPEVHAITDVTGFGLAGHLLEVCQASQVSAVVNFNELPLLDKTSVQMYFNEGAIPGGTIRNYKSYGDDIAEVDAYQRAIICDPQTSGGLLLSVNPTCVLWVTELLEHAGLHAKPIGEIIQHVNGKRRVNLA